MGWSENLFQNAERWLKRIDQQRKGFAPTDQAVRFEDIKPILNCWVALVSGRSWVLQEAETWPAVDSQRLFFPPLLDIFKDRKLNRRAYLYIACTLMGYDENKFSDLKKWRHQFQTASTHVTEGPEYTAGSLLLHRFENLSAQEENFVWSAESFRSLLNLWTVRKLPSSPMSRDSSGLEARRNSQDPTSTRKKKAREQIEVLNAFGDPESDNPLVHSFEKLHTTDDYKGGQKNQDGEDELSEQHDSLDELDLKQVVRSSQETRATLKGDFIMDLEVAESSSISLQSNSRIFQYDEWNEEKSQYHSKWCQLSERVPAIPKPGENPFEIDQVRKTKKKEIDILCRCFQTLFQTPRWKSRQQDGVELDLDSLVDFMATPLEKRPEKMNVYMSRRKNLDELSVVVLFDRSLSSDSWIDNRRVLDVTKESLVVIGEALRKFPLSVHLASFSSQTRNQIYYDVLKDFDEAWGPGLQRLGAIEPLGYTRIGPALRHAAYQLQNRKAKHKWILLLSDAKPSDYDKYEGRYGVRDVRKAIQEAKAQQIGVRCLSVERENRFELSEMFGVRGYELLPRVDDLPNRLGVLLKNLVQMAR